MYKKSGLLSKKRRPLHLIVNTKAGGRSSSKKVPKGAKIKIVDRRMKSDLRGQQRASDKRKGSKKTSKRKGSFVGNKKHPGVKKGRKR